MSKSLDTFVDSNEPLRVFVKKLESLLGVKFQRLSDNQETWYEFQNPRLTLTVGYHDFENDRDMNFEDYRYHLQVMSRNINTEEERQKWRDDFGRFVFEKLKATQKYRLMLAEDIQKKLDEFSPEATIAR